MLSNLDTLRNNVFKALLKDILDRFYLRAFPGSAGPAGQSYSRSQLSSLFPFRRAWKMVRVHGRNFLLGCSSGVLELHYQLQRVKNFGKGAFTGPDLMTGYKMIESCWVSIGMTEYNLAENITTHQEANASK